MDQIEQSILILSGGGTVSGAADAPHELKNAVQSPARTVSEVTVTTMQANMRPSLQNLSLILSVPPEDVGGLTLDTAEISAQIDGKGKFGIAGSRAQSCGVWWNQAISRKWAKS